MPGSAVEHERNVDVFCQRRRERIEKRLHADRVGVGKDQREGVVGAGLDGRIDVGVDVALIEQARRTLAALPPDMADAALLPDACLVLEIQPQSLISMCMLKVFERSPGSF